MPEISLNKHFYVQVKGPDTAVFLQRLSTQAVDKLLPGEQALCAFLTPKGKIVAATYYWQKEAATVWLVEAVPGGLGKLADWLETYHFVEDVEISLSREPIAVSFSPPSIENFLEGMKLTSHELSEEHNPLEVGLEEVISWSKGCYPGQEVMSRLKTYQKRSKRLCLVKGSLEAWKSLHAKQKLPSSLGEITSLAPYFKEGQPIALSVAKIQTVTQIAIPPLTIEVIPVKYPEP